MRPDDFQALPAPVQLDGSPPLAVPSVINPDIRRTSAPSVVSVGSATGHLAPGGVPGLTVDQMQQSLIYMIKVRSSCWKATFGFFLFLFLVFSWQHRKTSGFEYLFLQVHLR